MTKKFDDQVSDCRTFICMAIPSTSANQLVNIDCQTVRARFERDFGDLRKRKITQSIRMNLWTKEGKKSIPSP